MRKENIKRFFCLLTLALFGLALLAGCGSSGRKWRDTDVIDDYGTVTRDGKQIDVCVTHDPKAIYFYYDDEDHELFDTAMLPTDEICDKDWLLGNIILDDFTGDNNSDLQVYLEHADMSESYIVWTWEKGEGYVYQPDYSWFYDPIVIYGPSYDDTVNEAGLYEGIWLGDVDNQYDYIEFDADGNWQLYSGDDAIDDGYLWYDAESDTTYIYSYQSSAIDGGYVEAEGDRLYITTLGYFNYGDGMENYWYEDGGGDHDGGSLWNDPPAEDDEPDRNNSGKGNEYCSWNAELHQPKVTEFEGAWYCDGDLSADTCIIIDGDGNWSFYERVVGDAEGTEMDCGTFSYSTDEGSVYYADSAVYDGVSYRMFDLDEGVLAWDEYTYDRME